MVQESFEGPQSKAACRKPGRGIRRESRRNAAIGSARWIERDLGDRLRPVDRARHNITPAGNKFTSRCRQIVPGAALGSNRRLIRGVAASLGRRRSTLLGALRVSAVAGKLHGPARVVAVVAAILFAFIHQATAGGMRALLLLLFSHRSPLSGRHGPAGSRSGPS
jgi:hypothetical protein